MGEAKRRTESGSAPRKLNETHEPKAPVNWPHGHVSVEITDSDQGECVCVTIHGQRHYLHTTTFAALLAMGDQKLNEWLKSNPFPNLRTVVEATRKGNFD
ncbi:MAG TPA: hypothetical protein VIF34_07335 [Methylocystis sp.]|jgi:hypothetical protein